ncbi:metabotropic glutamate receptor 3-like [Stylophora pistillata]|uniref:metabotropic glutamate receptor 3-like n=1 Tax=Stylophora pistillata TaxID=50429 RepID=UPI000C03CC68|nr:metabotropic glutamate receptor 3-like [Stylophora pistillata]
MATINVSPSFVVHTFYSLLITALVLTKPLNVASLHQAKIFKPGDIIIGGLFPVHRSTSTDSSCTSLFKEGVVLTEAMVYAVKYVNENKLLPQQITLGYDIRDTCGKVITALKESLDFVNERKKVSSERESNSTTNLSTLTSLRNPIAVLGAGNSVISSAVNDILSIFRVPQVGYASTSRLLSNKNRYPTFLRTVPSDSHQGKAMARIVSNLGWNYVAMFASDDVYGRPLAETFKTEAKKLGICLALDILIPSHPPNGTIRKLVSKLRQNKNLNIILLFASEDEAVDFLQEAMLQNVAKKLWIASDSWADSPKIAEDNAEVVDGMLRIINQPIVVPDFMKDFYNLNPFNNPQNFWFSQFWEEIFQCSILKHNMTLLKENRFSLRAQCKGKEKLADKFLQTDAVFSRVSYVLDAVLSIVFSVRKICQSTLDTQTSSEVPRKNACINNITPSSVLSKIFNVTFTSVTNRTVLFNKNGDGMGRYDIINFQKRAEGGLNSTSLKIGEYDGETGFLKLARNSIHLPGGVTSPSFGLCSLECPPGTFKVVSKLICCWTCWTCPSGSISNTAGASSCTQCLSNKTPNESKSKCVSLPIRFLRWDSSWAWIVNVTILLCELTCLITVVIFLHNKETPIVKAANREISFLLLFGLMSGFLIPLLYIGRPTDTMCKIQVISFGTSTVFSLSMVLARINRTTVVFRYSQVARRSQSKFVRKYLRLFLYNRTQIMLALVFTVIELLLCTAWLLSRPPRVTTRRLTMRERLLMCEATTSLGHIISNAFIIFLSLLCTFVAFKSRKLPQNYNEAKFISFAMFVFNFVWLTFVSTFYGTPEGEHNVIINSFAILASNLAILTLIYGPKLYIILLRPDLNQMSVFRAITSQYTFRPSRRSSAITSDMMGNSCILKENKYVQTTVEIKEEICHEQICNEPVRVAIGFNSHDKEISKTVEVEEEGTESKERKDLEHRTWGHIRVLNMRAKSDTALSRSFDNPHALAFGKTEGKRACVEHTTDDANMLIHQEIVNQREKSSHRKYTSLNELQYPLKAEAAKESMHHLYRQEKERCAFSSKKQLESEV